MLSNQAGVSVFYGIRLTVTVISVLCSIVYLFVASALAGSIYCKRERISDGNVHISFTNGEVNSDKYPITYEFYGFGSNSPRERAEQPKQTTVPYRVTEKTGNGLAGKSDRYDKEVRDITDKISSISSNLSGNLLERKYQLKQIEALNGTLRALSPTGLSKKGFDDDDVWKQQDDIEERRSKTAIQTHIPTSVVDVTTGRQMVPVAGGIIDPGTGTFHTDVGGGYVNSETGTFSPKFGP